MLVFLDSITFPGPITYQHVNFNLLHDPNNLPQLKLTYVALQHKITTRISTPIKFHYRYLFMYVSQTLTLDFEMSYHMHSTHLDSGT